MPYVEASVRAPQIIAAARAVMTRDGVAAASMRVVATEAGVPLGTLQHVFRSKEQLLSAVFADVVDELTATLTDAVSLDRGLEHAIRGGMTEFWRRLVRGRPEGQLMQLELMQRALREPGLADLARVQYERYVDGIAVWFHEARTRASESAAIDDRDLARLALAGIDGLIVQYVCDPDDARADADVDRLVAMIVATARPC